MRATARHGMAGNRSFPLPQRSPCAKRRTTADSELPNMLDLLKAAFLGIIEGLTEFIPVSSTGHLLLVGHFLGFDDEDFGKTFAILIQLGAILALLWIYFERLWKIALALPSDPAARRFVIGVLVAFL